MNAESNLHQYIVDQEQYLFDIEQIQLAQGDSLQKLMKCIRQTERKLSCFKHVYITIDDYCETCSVDLPSSVRNKFENHVTKICCNHDVVIGTLDLRRETLYPLGLLNRIANSGSWSDHFRTW